MCPSGTYANLANNECTQCVLPCSTCTNSTACLTCTTGYNLFGTECKSTCLTGYTPINGQCVQCTSPCETCAGTVTTCLSCLQTTPLFLFSYRCLSSCPTTTYANTLKYECTNCSLPCLTCSSATSCQSCMGNYYLFNTSCLQTCPTGYVGLITDCVQCKTGCRTC